MTAKTQKSAGRRVERDAYDDFLDGVVTPVKKKRASGKTASSRSGASAAGRKAAPAKASGSKSSSGKTSSGAKKTAGTGRKASSGTSRKGAGVEAGIVSLGSRAGTASGKQAAKPVKRKNAVLIADNPVAKGDSRARPESRRASSTGRTAQAKRSGGSRSSGSQRRTTASGRPRRMDDPFMEKRPSAANRKRVSGSQKRAKKKRSRMGGWDIFLSAGIICMLAFMVWQGTQYMDFLTMKQAVSRQTYYPGTTVDGIDVSDMTYETAMEYWRTQVEPRYTERTVVFDNGESVKASQLGYSSDYETVLANAWSAGRSGTLEERYRAISSRRETPIAYSVTRVSYDEDTVERFAIHAAEQVDTPVTEAKIESFNTKKFEFVFSDPQPGKKLNQAAFSKSVMQALDAGGGSVQMVFDEIQPTTTKKSVAKQYGMITSAITNASSSSSNRITNIKRSLELINGTCLKPGETFSFNGVVGERTKARGFKEATAYSSGEVTEQVGGGICQVSTTLFNAAVKADLEINERHNHSLTVGYVDKGKDAAVNWGSQDLRFTNNTGDDIYICCYLTKDKRVRFGIFGKLLPNGETITVEGKTTGEIEFETEQQVTGLLAPGEKVVLQKGKKGYTAEAYKLRWDAKGNLISKELLCKSKYKAVNEIIQYGM